MLLVEFYLAPTIGLARRKTHLVKLTEVQGLGTACHIVRSTSRSGSRLKLALAKVHGVNAIKFGNTKLVGQIVRYAAAKG